MVSRPQPELARPTLRVRLYFHLLTRDGPVPQKELAETMNVGTEKVSRAFSAEMFDRDIMKNRPRWLAKPSYLAESLLGHYERLDVPLDRQQNTLVDFVTGPYANWLKVTPAPPTRWEEHLEQIAEFAAGADALATFLSVVKSVRLSRDEIRKAAAEFVLDEKIIDSGLRTVARLSSKLERKERERLQRVRTRLTVEDRKISQAGVDVILTLIDLSRNLRAGIVRTSVRGQQTMMTLEVLVGSLGPAIDNISRLVEGSRELHDHRLTESIPRRTRLGPKTRGDTDRALPGTVGTRGSS